MNKIDLIIDALEISHTVEMSASDRRLCTEALAAARELKALKPMAWMDKEDCGDMRFTSVEPTYENNLIRLYALDEVTK
jgi:hypothetical protein